MLSLWKWSLWGVERQGQRCPELGRPCFSVWETEALRGKATSLITHSDRVITRIYYTNQGTFESEQALFILTLGQQVWHSYRERQAPDSFSFFGGKGGADESFMELQFTYHTVYPVLLYNSVSFSKFTEWSWSILEHFHYPQRNPVPFSNYSPTLPSTPLILGRHEFIFLYRFTYFGHFIYMGSYNMCGLLWLPSWTWHNVLCGHPWWTNISTSVFFISE